MSQRIAVTEAVREAYVDLTAWARADGHPLCAKDHVGDRWVAATVLAYGVELAAIDAIYDGVQRLRLLGVPRAQDPSSG